jgi:hypothetical protein
VDEWMAARSLHIHHRKLPLTPLLELSRHARHTDIQYPVWMIMNLTCRRLRFSSDRYQNCRRPCTHEPCVFSTSSARDRQPSLVRCCKAAGIKCRDSSSRTPAPWRRKILWLLMLQKFGRSERKKKQISAFMCVGQR